MIIIVVLMYMDEEPNYSLESLNKPLLLLLLLILLLLLLLGKFVSLHELVFNENGDYMKVLLYYFSCKCTFFVIIFALFGMS